MKTTGSMRRWHICPGVVCGLALTLAMGGRGQVQTKGEQLDALLARLAGEHVTEGDVEELEGQPQNERTIPALRAAFSRQTEKEKKQWIAGSLIRLGDRSDLYFDYLAGYAKVAVEDRAPDFVKYDSAGRGLRGQFSAEFLEWCARNGKEPRALAALQFGVYPPDVLALAKAGDSRARELFRRGLESPNPLVLGYCVQGLGRLHDEAALPVIGQAISRVPAGDRVVVSGQLPWFDTPAADRLFEQVTPEPRTREFWQKSVITMRQIESDRIGRRTGAGPK